MSVNGSRQFGAWATGWRSRSRAILSSLRPRLPIARVGFWRAQVEMFVVGQACALVAYPLAWLVGSPLVELVSLPLMSFYAIAAWRLEPGKGGLLRRGGRVLAWVLLYATLEGVIGWNVMRFMPHSGQVFGIRTENLHMSLAEYLPNLLVMVCGLFIPTRMLLALWAAGRARLRWHLTFSYLLVGILTTLLIPVALGVFIGISSLFTTPVQTRSADLARLAAEALGPLLRSDVSPGQLTPVLQGLMAGHTRLPVPAGPGAEDFEPAAGARAETDGTIPTFGGVRRMLVLRPDGVVLGSAGADAPAPGSALPADDAADLALLLAQVRGGGCANGRPSDGPLADSAACAILDERGTLLATLIVENMNDGRFQWAAAITRVMSTVLVATTMTLLISLIVVVIILLLAFGVGYLLARRLTRRLEGLALATGDLAAGNLTRRVEIDSPDEIGRLSGDFNVMAGRLEERERALAAEVARTEALLRANRRLVADVSHELRTPLATLRGYLEALEQEHGEQLPAHDMSVIQGEMRRLTALIDDLFTLARAEARQLPLTVELVDAAALIRRLVDTLAPLARRERQVELVAALPDELPPVSADRVRLEQVLLNLIQNALRHTPPGGIVAFEGAAGDDGVTLAVADTGVGIPAEELALIFERFYRSDSSRARETGGAGLGLALVRELVTAMGGSVSAESTLGRGSRFSVVLRPAVRAKIAQVL